MRSSNSPLSWTWKLLVCAIVCAVGYVVGGGLATALGIELPQAPAGTDEMAQTLMLFPAGAMFAVGLAAMALGLAGRLWERWLILTVLLWGINGVGNAVESMIFTTIGAPVGLALSFLPPAALCALAVAWLFPGPSDTRFADKAREFFSDWKTSKLVRRILLGILAFPVIYLFFGLVVSPIVVPLYNQLDFLKIPPPSVMFPVLLCRSALILAVTLPVIIGWESTRNRAILGLGIGNAVAVGLGGLILAPFFPALLRWVHGLEILADGLVYGWVLVLLFIPKLSTVEKREIEPVDEAA